MPARRGGRSGGRSAVVEDLVAEDLETGTGPVGGCVSIQTTATRIVFPLLNEAGKQFYSTVEFNPLQTEGVISKEEVQAALEKLQSGPNFNHTPPVHVRIMMVVLLLAIIGSFGLIPLWVTYFEITNKKDGVQLFFCILLSIAVPLAWVYICKF